MHVATRAQNSHEGKCHSKTTPKRHHLKKVKSLNNREPKPRFFVQYRGNITQNFACRLKKLCDIQIIFTTRKLRTCLPTLKSLVDKNLKSHLVYKVTCNGCNSIYVAKPADLLPLEFQRIKRRIPLLDNTLLNVVVQRIT